MPSTPSPEPQDLLQFSTDVLSQALALVAWHEASAAPAAPAASAASAAAAYASPVGAHLRHVIEHFDALLCPVEPGVVDYDKRPRDRDLERQPTVARARIAALQTRLLACTDAQLAAPVQVRGLGGLAGDFGFAVNSTLGRELVFVASHAIHHYALLQAHYQQQGIPTAADVGRAPATVAHERAAPPVSVQRSPKEAPCTA